MKTPIDYTYHCHTYRCGHAFGTDEEYVRAAIAGGFKVLGFSDHVILPDFAEPGMRGDPEMLEGYLASIRQLKAKYADSIEIHLGFECEWFDGRYLEYYKSLLKDKVEYLILGQHCYLDEGGFVFYRGSADKAKALEHYTRSVVEAIESGLFSYVAHPDYICYFYPHWDSSAIEAARKIFAAAMKYKIPLELNMCQSHWPRFKGRTDYDYPNDKFWELAKDYDVEVILGVDAHSPDHLVRPPFEFYLDFANRHGLKLINKLAFLGRK